MVTFETSYESCVVCEANLFYEERQVGDLIVEVSFGYCHNLDCTRYLLFTMEQTQRPDSSSIQDAAPEAKKDL